MADRTLSTSAERRTDVLLAAIAAFARTGYFGTTTTDIADAAGISQAYVYRLFATKDALFIAALDEAMAQVNRRLDDLAARGTAIDEILRDSGRRPADDDDSVGILLQAAAAGHIPAIGEAVRACYRDQADRLAALGATDAQIRTYFADSLFANVLRTVGVRPRGGDRRLLPDFS